MKIFSIILLIICTFVVTNSYSYNYSELTEAELKELAKSGDTDAASQLAFSLLSVDRARACVWFKIAADRGKLIISYKTLCQPSNTFTDNSPHTPQNDSLDKYREDNEKKNQQMIDDYIIMKSLGIF